jgi:tripartite-type tricarboxylate transporter receptor subunit TctC
MTNRKHLAVVAAIFSLACATQRASAQTQPREYPVKPVRIIVPTSPGGLLDLVVRILAQKMAEVTGQNVLVDNRPGASNNIGTELAARAPADGYAVLSATLPLVANPSLFDKLPFNVEKDFAPVSQLVAAPYVVVVHPSVPVRSIKELIALARAKPGTLNYSTGGNGTNLHMATELFRNQTGINIVHLAYKGAGPALAALLSGEADLSFPSLGPAMPQLKGGRVRALAITSARRSPLLPDLPTVMESGVPDYTFASWVGVLLPSATPPAIVAALNGHVVKSMRAADVVSRLSADGTEVVASSPEQFRGLIKSELSRWAAVVKSSGMKAE